MGEEGYAEERGRGVESEGKKGKARGGYKGERGTWREEGREHDKGDEGIRLEGMGEEKRGKGSTFERRSARSAKEWHGKRRGRRKNDD